MGRRALLVAAAGAWLLASCGRYFAPNRHLEERVDRADLVGTWHLTAASLENLARDGFQAQAEQTFLLELRADGSCRFESFLQAGGGRYRVLNGRWNLLHDTTRGSNVRKANLLQLELAGGVYGADLNLAREDGELLLWSFYGDPDLWLFLEYARRP